MKKPKRQPTVETVACKHGESRHGVGGYMGGQIICLVRKCMCNRPIGQPHEKGLTKK